MQKSEKQILEKIAAFCTLRQNKSQVFVHIAHALWALTNNDRETAKNDVRDLENYSMEKKEPRGLRNNNPLNIRYVEKNRWQGRVPAALRKDEDFEEFVALYWGFRAAFILIYNYMNKYGKRTINDIISTWAPPSDGNATGWYVEEVADRIGIPSNQTIYFEDGQEMMHLVQEMARVECGKFIELPAIAHGYYLACKSLGITPAWPRVDTIFYVNYNEMKKMAEDIKSDLI